MDDRPAKIVDAHHHLWNPTTGQPDIGYVWLRDVGAPKPFGDPTPIQRDYPVQEFAVEPAPSRFAASVHLQADGAIPDPVAETRFIQSLSDKNDFPIAIVGFVDLASEDAATVIEEHKKSANFRGVRQILSRLPDQPERSFATVEYLDDLVWRENFILLGEHGLSFDLQCYPEQMERAAAFFSAHKNVPVIIDHAGSPWVQTAEGFKRWYDSMAQLAALPQTSVKLAGFGMFDVHWNAETISPVFNALVDLFGYERMLFASNFPVDKLMRPYHALLDDFTLLCTNANETQRAAFFHDNARRIYRI